MAPTYPAGVTAQGNVKVLFTPTASLTAPSIAAITGVGSIDVSCFLQQGAWAPTSEANKGTAPARLCDTRQFEKFGLTTESVSDLTYVVDPQAATGSDGKLAFEALVEGTGGYFVERLGSDAQDDFVAGEFVRVIPVIVGPQNFTADTSDEFAEIVITQAVAVLAPGAGGLVALVA